MSRQRATKPQLKTIQNLLAKKEEAVRLLQEVEDETFELLEKYGEVRFDYELETPITNSKGKECNYLKFEIINNLRKASEGEIVPVVSVFKNTTYLAGPLIKIPESLK